MPFPSSSLVTLRPDLAESVELFNLAEDRLGFIGSQVLSPIDVMKATGNFGIIPLEQLLQTPDTTRAPGSGYARGRWSFKPSTYATIEHGWEEPVDDNEATLYDSYFKAEAVSAARALDFVLRGYEIRVATACLSTSNVTAYAGASATWDANPSTATPFEDIETGIQTIYNNTGLWPNAIAMHQKTFRYLRKTSEVQSLIKYSGHDDPKAARIAASAIAEMFAIDRVLIAGSAKNTADEGQTASIAGIWDKTKVLIFRGDWSDDPKRPCLGRTFHWSEDGSSMTGTMESYREERVRGTIIRCRQQTAEQIIYGGAGYLVTSVISSGG